LLIPGAMSSDDIINIYYSHIMFIMFIPHDERHKDILL
jgi:hypothetical protein